MMCASTIASATAWQPGEIDAAKDIGTVALSIEMGGYRLISLRPHLA